MESRPHQLLFQATQCRPQLSRGLTVTKSADKVNWVDGPLTYTVVIKNDSGST